MKHKLFNNIYPYIYYIKHIKSGIKYVGVRFANVKQCRSPQKENYVSERNLYRAKICKGKATSRNNWIIEYLSD